MSKMWSELKNNTKQASIRPGANGINVAKCQSHLHA